MIAAPRQAAGASTTAMTPPPFIRGPIAGEPSPLYGGAPGDAGCNGCVDCCHFPEISVTDEEAARLSALYEALEEPAGPLIITPSPERPGWQLMQGPCAFRGLSPARRGCRIYEERPASCAIFTCAFLLERRRARW